MIESIRSKALRRYWQTGQTAGINAAWLKRVKIVMAALDAAMRPEDLNLPGLGFHALTGDMAGRYTVRASANWRITFGWDSGNAVDVDMEDYHGH